MPKSKLLTKLEMARVADYDTRQARMNMNLALAEEREQGKAKLPLDLENAFWTLQTLKKDMAMATFDIDDEIEQLKAEKARREAPYWEDIETIEAQIKEAVGEKEESFKCSNGQAIYRSGARKVTWDDGALMGYVAAGHPEIEQFRQESEGKPSIVLKVEGI